MEIIREAWKGLLIDIPPESGIKEMPALEDLKRKILIKVKWAPATSNAPSDEAPDSLEQRASQDAGESSSMPKEENASSPPKPFKILPVLSRLAVYTKAYHFDHFAQPGITLSEPRRPSQC